MVPGGEVGSLPQLPPVLIQSAELETYLRELNAQLADRLSCLWVNVAEMQRTVRNLDVYVKLIRKFLREHAVFTLSDRLFEDEFVFNGSDAIDSFLPEFLRAKVVDSDLDLGSTGSCAMNQGEHSSDIGDKFSRLNRIGRERYLRRKERNDEEKRLQVERMEACRRVESMCRSLEAAQASHMDKLERISHWLHPIPDYENFCSESSGGDGSDEFAADLKAYSKGARLVKELHETIRNAPIFLEFRRMLLRDVSERLVGALDQHSMEVAKANDASADGNGSSRKGKRRTGGALSCEEGGSNSSPPDSASVAEQQLKRRNSGYVHLHQVEALLSAKEAAAAVLNKSSENTARVVEGRLLRRIEDLEGRMALYEAERKEFRKILSSVVDAHRRKQGVGVSLRETVLSSSSPVKSESLGGHSDFRLHEMADPRYLMTSGSSTGQGTRRSCSRGRVGVPPDSKDSSWGAAQPAERLPVADVALRHVMTTAPTHGGGLSGLANGIPTANQAAYLSYVMGRKESRDSEGLPPVQYERKMFM